MTSAVGAALRSGAELCRAATQPGFAILGCGAILSDEINATESNNKLIWTALGASICYSPAGLIPKLESSKDRAMKRILPLLMVITALALALCGGANSARDKQDKYTLKVPGGLAFSDFKGYEDWQA